MDPVSWYAVTAAIVDLVIVFGLGYRVVMRRRPVGVTLAWLVVIAVFPVLGAIVYLLFGETRLGEARAERAEELSWRYREWLKRLPRDAAVDWSRFDPECKRIHDLAVGTVGIPTLNGNRIELFDQAEAVLRGIMRDIEAAQETVHLEFYIWHPGGTADDVVEALVAAARRGVTCRVLLDDIGSGTFFRHDQSRRLKEAGVHLVPALRAGVLRTLVQRADHRLHRKVVVVDGRVAWTGSLNLVDPRFFKQGAGVGEWVDAMARIEGPVVEAMAVSFIADWEFETGEGIAELAKAVHVPPKAGDARLQLLPSGPGYQPEAIHRMLLMTIYAARKELVLTTPYFVPSEPLLTALESAGLRGVDVTIVLPARNDSFLVQYAARSTFAALLAAGVRIAKFERGLLHTKSITVDGSMSVFGSVNLDMRSFYLNFEISLFAYDKPFTRAVRALQQSYIDQSELLAPKEWSRRPARQKLVENLCHLASPLL